MAIHVIVTNKIINQNSYFFMNTRSLFFKNLISVLQNSLQDYAWKWEFSETNCMIFDTNLTNSTINNSLNKQHNFCYFIDYQEDKNIELGLQFFENTDFPNNFEYYTEQIKLQTLQKRYNSNQATLKITNNAIVSQLMIANLSIDDLTAHLGLILQQIHSDFWE